MPRKTMHWRKKRRLAQSRLGLRQVSLCSGKVSYPNEKEAEAARKFLPDGDILRSYPCTFHGYHLATLRTDFLFS